MMWRLSLMAWRAWCWAAHWPHHEVTPWEPGEIHGYCHACKRKWIMRG
jgi:hypothetical protein